MKNWIKNNYAILLDCVILSVIPFYFIFKIGEEAEAYILGWEHVGTAAILVGVPYLIGLHTNKGVTLK